MWAPATSGRLDWLGAAGPEDAGACEGGQADLTGFMPRVVFTECTLARPSRSVEVRLSPPEPPKRAPSAAPESGPRPATPASLGKPAVATGTLAIESLPSGASVAINGTPGGTTPVTISDLPPGEYRVTITLQGYRPFATTVRVVAGERARAAARLTEQEQE